MRNSSGLPTGGAIFTREPIGPCGGMVTGLSQSTDGNYLYVRCDVFGGARRKSGETKWVPLITSASLPSANYAADLQYTNTDRPGITEIVCAPSSGAVVLMQWCGWTFRSTNGGDTWVQMTVPRQTLNNNGNGDRYWGRKMAIHPTNPDIAIVGTQSTNLYYTTNLTTTTPTWTAIPVSAAANEPNGLNPIQHLVAFNTFNPSEVWIAVGGVALLKSTTGVSGTFTSFATTAGGAAIKPQRLKFTDAGTMYFTQYGQADNLYKLTNGGGSLTAITLGGKQLIDIALDWSNANHIVGFTVDGTVIETTDGGTTWPHLWDGAVNNIPPQQLIRASIGKALDAGVTREWSPSFNNVEFNRAVAGQLINACGIGYLKTTLPTWVSATASPIVWIEDLAGDIPMLVTQCGVFAGDGTALYGVHDEGVWAVTDPTRYTNVRDQPPSLRDQPHLLPPIIVQPCTDLRVAADDGSYVYGFQHGGTWLDVGPTHGPIASPHFGYNTNYGKPGSWHAYPTEPSNKPYTFGGGYLLVGNKGRVAHIYNADGTPEYTEDGGTTWHNLNIPGLAAQLAASGHGIEYQGNGFWLNRRVGDYDKVAGKYRIFIYGGIIGFYEATNLSDTWTRVSTDAPISQSVSSGHVWHCHLVHVPGVANKAYWTNGNGDYANDPFMVTTDGCRNWTAISKSWGTVKGVTTFDFSAPAGPGLPPCMMFHGKVTSTTFPSGQYGYFRTDDDFATEPKLLAIYPMNWIDQPMRIFGNPSKYHDFRICYSGSGAIKVTYDYHLTAG